MSLFVTEKDKTEQTPVVVDETGASAEEDFSLFRDKPSATADETASASSAGPKRRAFFAIRRKADEVQPALAASAGAEEEPLEVESRILEEQPQPSQQPAVKKRFSFGRQKAVASEGAGSTSKDPKSKRKLRIPKFQALPIQVVIGYLPEVTERDAREYAMGIAEKHFQQIGLTYYGVFEYDGGFVFELHEGGQGKAYVPSILSYFRSQGTYQPDEHVSAVLAAAQRKVEVVRTRQGLTALLLPEGAEAPVSEWLTPSKAMSPVIHRQQKFFAFGLGFFVVGAVAMVTTALFFRIQGYLPPVPPKVETISADTLPRSQWKRVLELPEGASIKALRYANGKWADIELYEDAADEEPGAGEAEPTNSTVGEVTPVLQSSDNPQTNP